MKEKKTHTLYRKAKKADDLFEDAIKSQFGPQATRWDHDKNKYNRKTMAAYYGKLQADELYLNACNLTR